MGAFGGLNAALGLGLDPAKSLDGAGRDVQDLIDGLAEMDRAFPAEFVRFAEGKAHIPPVVIDGVALACMREAYRARGRGEEDVADACFANAMLVFRHLRAVDEGFQRQEDLSRALLESARKRAGEPGAARALLEEAERELGRSWVEHAMPLVVDRWLEELGPSKSFVRPGR